MQQRNFCTHSSFVTDAELVICPYNYLLDPGSRDSADIDLTDPLVQSVLIFDEAQYVFDKKHPE
jgi:Rad3-related DNA helicase